MNGPTVSAELMVAVELAIEELFADAMLAIEREKKRQAEEEARKEREETKLWTIDQLATRWQLSERVINRWIREGWIEIGLFPGKPSRSNWRVSEKQRRKFEAFCEERGADWVAKEIKGENDEEQKT